MEKYSDLRPNLRFEKGSSSSNHLSCSQSDCELPITDNHPLQTLDQNASPISSPHHQPTKKTRCTPSPSQGSQCFETELCHHPKKSGDHSLRGKVYGRVHPTITIDFWGVEQLPLQSRDLQSLSVPPRLSSKSMGEPHGCNHDAGIVARKVG